MTNRIENSQTISILVTLRGVFMVRLRTALLVGFFLLVAVTQVEAVTDGANLTASQSPPNSSTTTAREPSLTQFVSAENFSGGSHNFRFTSGESRGQIFAVLSEPSSVSLLGIGLLVAGYIGRRQFRKR